MSDEQLAKCLAELGNVTRLKIYKLLVKAGSTGLAVGVVQEKLHIPGSTLSHHLSKLTSANLIRQEREGRVLHCIASYEVLDAVICELKNQCCLGVEE